jgi:hypothetical protein
MVRPRRLAADIDDVGPLPCQRQPMRDRDRRVGEEAAIGKGIRGDVDHAHQQGPGAEAEPSAIRQCQRGGHAAIGLMLEAASYTGRRGAATTKLTRR